MTDGFPPATFDDDEPTSIGETADVGSFFGGRFRIDERLGSGAMGKVLSALDTQTGALVALKVLHRDRSKDPDVLRRFGREARALSAIAHPAIVGIVASGRAPDGTPWLAMEHLVGMTLKDRIKRGRMEVAELWPIMKLLAEAMASAHAAGVVHRDLKPENVILVERPPPIAKILDFGLSSLSRETERVTKTGEVLGTPRYMAPELLTSKKKPDHRVDVYALGVITFEALTGESIYSADDLGSLFGQILEGRTRLLRSVRPDLTERMEVLIQQATAHDQDERFGSVTAFVTAFGHAAGFHDAPEPARPSQLSALFDDMTSADAEAAPLLDPFSGGLIAAPRLPTAAVRAPLPTPFAAPSGPGFPRPHAAFGAPSATPPGTPRPQPGAFGAPAMALATTVPDKPSPWPQAPEPAAPTDLDAAKTIYTPHGMSMDAPHLAPPPVLGPAPSGSYQFSAPAVAPLPISSSKPRSAQGSAAGQEVRAFSSGGLRASTPTPAPVAPSSSRPTLVWALFGLAALVVVALASCGALLLRWLLVTGRL